MSSATQPLLANPRLRQTGLAILLGIAILGSVYLVDRGNSQQTGIQQITAPGAASAQALRVGQPAPDFQVTSPDGQPITLAQFKGQPVWLNFWASWCAPCRVEFPDMDAVYRQHQASGLVLLAVSFAEQPADVSSYLERARPSFTIGVDPPGVVAGQYRVLGLPTHIFIDADGIVREVRVGPMNQELMQQKLATILPPGR
jgi:cytochrome c biogenesis protein CcmG/thiol:disulfide interchange protein DsbE